MPAPPTSDAIVPPPPAPTPSGAESPERIDELRAQLDELTHRTTTIDARVSSVSLELANQLTELSREIDDLHSRRSEPAEGSPGLDIDAAELEARLTERLDVAIDDVLDSTERLAAEQARYEIQFRADLAELADRLRRPGTA